MSFAFIELACTLANVFAKSVQYVLCSSIKKKVKKSSGAGNTATGNRTLPSQNNGASPLVGRRSAQVPLQPVDPNEAMGWALVRYNYQAQQQDELPLTKGSRVLVLEKSNDGSVPTKFCVYSHSNQFEFNSKKYNVN